MRICHESLLRSLDPATQELVLLDSKNFLDYVSLPGYIMDKFRKGTITVTHLSDIIRSALLKDTGGLWTDATMFFPGRLEPGLFERDFFTIKNTFVSEKNITSRWECFFIAGKRSFPLFGFLNEMWLEYWKRENDLIAYLLTDHVFYIAYQENAQVRRAIDSCPGFHYRIDYFQRLLNSAYDEKIFKEICENEPFIKLSYKFPLRTNTRDGSITCFGRLMEVYGRG